MNAVSPVLAKSLPLRWTAPLVLVICCGILLAAALLQGWYPHDEGALGQSAERLLAGEWPHRDFDEIYTLLLSVVHAAMFAVTEPSSAVMRLPLFVAALGWIVIVYRLLLRALPPAGAAVVAFAAMLWSVPNYPAPMPSWYVLFVATAGALALVKWLESGDLRWVFVAGCCGGVAFLFKLNGVLFVAGGGLALLLTASVAPSTFASGTDGAASGARLPRALVTLGFLVAAGTVAWVLGRAGEAEFVRFALPTFTVLLALTLRSARDHAVGPHVPLRAFRPLVVFVCGAVVPVAALGALYAALGGFGALIDGVFVAPFRREAFAAMRPPTIVVLAPLLPLALLLWIPTVGRRAGVVAALSAAVWFGTVVALSASLTPYYRAGWFAAWGLVYLVAFESARRVLTADLRSPLALRALVLSCIAIALGLLEYPFAAPVYVLYSVPMVLVALTFLVRASGRVALPVQGVVLAFLLAFGSVRILPGTVDSLGRLYLPSSETARLDLPRGGLRVTVNDSARFSTLIPFVQEVAAGRTIWAGPDAPEVYFLSGLPNQTRTLFDFLDADDVRATPLVERLEQIDADVAVIKLEPGFSPSISPATVSTLRQRYPELRMLNGYAVLWR